MKKVICPVENIYSYQTLVKQSARGRYRTKRYTSYMKELAPNVRKLKSIECKETPLLIHITFNVKNAVELEQWKVVMKDTGNTSRIYYAEREALRNAKEQHVIKYSPAKIKFGATGDDDNIVKPIKDLMEDLAIIPNDRQGCYTTIEFTYNNPSNSIMIELEELKTVVDDDGIFRFERFE